MKIKLTESEEEYRCQLRLRRLRFSKYWIAGVVSGTRRINQSKCLRTGIVIGWFLHFGLRLRRSSFHWIISVGVISGIGRKWNRSDSSDCRFSLGQKRYYDYDSDSVASENQSLDGKHEIGTGQFFFSDLVINYTYE